MERLCLLMKIAQTSEDSFEDIPLLRPYLRQNNESEPRMFEHIVSVCSLFTVLSISTKPAHKKDKLSQETQTHYAVPKKHLLKSVYFSLYGDIQ